MKPLSTFFGALAFILFSINLTYAVPPVGLSVSIDEGDFTSTTSINLTLTASGPASIEMRIDAGGGFGAWQPFAANIGVNLTAANGLKTVQVEFRDAGNPSDNAGPVSDTITLDTVDPNLTLVSIASDNPDTALAKSGDTITVSFTSDETIQNVSATIAGEVATVINTAGNNWTAALTLDGDEPDGPASFAIDFEDQAGNDPGSVNTVTDASGVTIDNTTPILSSVSIASDNANPTFAKTGDIVTISFISSETITNVSGTIDGESATVMNGGGNNWTATLATDGDETQGVMSFALDFEDSAGNIGTTVTSVTDVSSVTFDSVTPTLSSVSITSNNGTNTDFATTGDTITISFTASETIINVSGTIDGEAATIMNTGGNNWTATLLTSGDETEGILPFALDFEDSAGNIGTTITSVTDASSIIFDMTDPVFESLSVLARDSGGSNKSMAPDGNFYIKNGEQLYFSLNINPADTWATGNNVDFTIGGIPQSTAAFISSTSPVTNRNRTYTLSTAGLEGAVAVSTLSFTDQAGNAISGFIPPSLNIIADQTVPTLTSVSISSNNAVSPNAYAKTNDTVTVAFTSSEPVQNVSATIDGESATVMNVGGNDWEATLLLSGDETEGVPLTFTIDFEDYATNPGTQVTGVTDASSIIFDMTDPMITSVNFESDNTFFLGDLPTTYSTSGDDLIITATVNDSISGISMTDAIFFDGVSGQVTVPFVNTSGSTWVATYTTNGSEQEGVVPFSATATDNAGNMLTVSATTDGSSTIHDYTNPTLPTTVLDLDGVQTDQFKHRSNADEYTWSGHSDPLGAGAAVNAGIYSFVIDYVHNSNLALANEVDTEILSPTTSFVPVDSPILPDNDPYELSMEVFDKAGNSSGESVVYSQKYAIALVGKVTNQDGDPLSGASVAAVARAGEVCRVKEEICADITDQDGNFYILIRDSANYSISASTSSHFLAKDDVFVPVMLDNLEVNFSLQSIAGNLIQTTTETVQIQTSQTYTAADGNPHPTFITVTSLGGVISSNEVGGGVFEVTSLSRIISITSNNPNVEIIGPTLNVYTIKGAGSILSTKSLGGTEGVESAVLVGSSSASFASGSSRLGVRRASGSGKRSLRIAGQARSDFQRLNREFMTYEESLAAAAEMNEGIPARVEAYVNSLGYIVFKGYQSGRLPMEKVGKRYQNTVRPSGRFVVQKGASLAAQKANIESLVRREESPEDNNPIQVAGYKRMRPGDELVVVANFQEKLPMLQAQSRKYRPVVDTSGVAESRILGKDQSVIKLRIGGKSVSAEALFGIEHSGQFSN